MRKWEIVRPESGEESGISADIMLRPESSQSGGIEQLPTSRSSIRPEDILVQHRVQCVRIPMKKLNYDRITTTIEREWLAQIIAGTKKIEYRQIKPYWTKRFAKVSAAIRTAAVERDESASAGSDRADPQDHEGSPGGRV